MREVVTKGLDILSEGLLVYQCASDNADNLSHSYVRSSTFAKIRRGYFFAQKRLKLAKLLKNIEASSKILQNKPSKYIHLHLNELYSLYEEFDNKEAINRNLYTLIDKGQRIITKRILSYL